MGINNLVVKNVLILPSFIVILIWVNIMKTKYFFS
jgi:hypothetical protein